MTDTKLIRHCATRRPDPTRSHDPHTAVVLITPLIQQVNPRPVSRETAL